MKSCHLLTGLLLPTIAFAADPAIREGSVVIDQNAATAQVSVSYELTGAPAIVTVDFQTNGVTIGAVNFRNVEGDVNRLVEPGNRTLTWNPTEIWPGQKLKQTAFSARLTVWSPASPPDYMVIHIAKDVQHLPPQDRTAYYVAPDAAPFDGGVTNDLCKTDYIVFRKCPAANVRFALGCSTNGNFYAAKWNQHWCTLTSDFYIGIFEVTQKQYANFGGGPASATANSTFRVNGDMRPVETVPFFFWRGWSDANESEIAKGKRKYWPETGHDVLITDAYGSQWGSGQTNTLWLVRQITGQAFDFPTCAQWEFAAQAGHPGAIPDGTDGKTYLPDATGALKSGENRLQRYARIKVTNPGGDTLDSSFGPDQGGTAIVGSYLPNAWGIYDMCGNVAEWCLDNWANYTKDEVIDPPGPATTGKERTVCGGSWKDDAWNAFNGQRSKCNVNEKTHPECGFRLCLTLP